MKLIFDYQIFSAQKHGGISRYFCNLIKNLKNDPEIQVSLPINHHDNEYLKEMPEIADIKQGEKTSFNFFKKKPDQNPLITNDILRQGNFDVLHTTYYDDYFLDSIGKKPFVVTVHDMIYEIFPELFPLKDRTALIKKEISQKADKIIVVSEYSKRDMLKFMDIREEKIDVIYPACSLDENLIKNQHFTKLNGINEYLLFVGNRSVYKNFYFMLASIAKTLKETPHLDLVCFGAPFDKKEKYYVEKLGLEKKVKVVTGSDYDLIGLYKNAFAFITPSYYEGFGVTVLEAFACGCPVLASNASAIPEACGDAVIYFDPKDNASIKNALEKLINNPELRPDMIARGYEQNKRFAWPQIAAQMKQAYQSIS